MNTPPDDRSQRTLAHYDNNAADFWQATRDHDVSQNIASLLRFLPARTTPQPQAILDFGCGPGRDLKTFRDLGFEAIGLDGSSSLLAIARSHADCEVWQQDFLQLDLPAARFDGVFANASLFHVPRSALPGVLAQLFATLKPGGVLFCSNPRGAGEEGWQGERYGCWHSWPQWQTLLGGAGFIALDHYYRPPGLPRAQQPWLASVWRHP